MPQVLLKPNMLNIFSSLFSSKTRQRIGSSAKESRWGLYIFIAILVVLQIIVAPYFEFKGVGFNLILVFLLVWVFYSEGKEVTPLLFAGILLDLFSAERFGIWTLALVLAVLVYLFLGLFISNVGTLISKTIIVLVLAGFCVFVPFFLQQLFMLISKETPIVFGGTMVWILIFEMLFNLLVYVILVLPMTRFLDRLSPKRVVLYK